MNQANGTAEIVYSVEFGSQFSDLWIMCKLLIKKTILDLTSSPLGYRNEIAVNLNYILALTTFSVTLIFEFKFRNY